MAAMKSAPLERVLIVRLGAIGDVVNALTLATALHDRRPDVRIGWAVHELAAPLVDGHPAIDRVHVWRKGAGVRGFRAVASEIRAARYGLAIDLQRIAKSALLARLSGAPRVLGFDRARSKECSWLLTRERLPRCGGTRHMVDQYREFAAYLGCGESLPRFELPSSATALERPLELLNALRVPPIAIHVGATKPANRWEPQRFGQLAALCVQRLAIPVVITGGPSDRPAADVATSADPRIRNWAGESTLLELAELQRRCRLVISCDSGPMHLAAAAGARVLALFGAADELRTGPYGPGHRVVRVQPACSPCGLRECSQPRHHCMLDLDVERVFGEVRAMLNA